MTDATGMDGHHRATMEKIFNHPVSHNIQWHDVLSLLESVADVTKESDGRYRVTLGDETETFDVCSGEPESRRRPARKSRPRPGRHDGRSSALPYQSFESRTPGRAK